MQDFKSEKYLSSDTNLHFDSSSFNKQSQYSLWPISASQIYKEFQPKQSRGNSFWKRDEIQCRLLRSLNEETEGVKHTNILDIKKGGMKGLWRLDFDGKFIKSPKNCSFLTNNGWLKLEEIVNLDTLLIRGNNLFSCITRGLGTGPKSIANLIDLTTEAWCPIPEWEDRYAVSNQGRVKRLLRSHGTPAGSIHSPIILDRYASVRLSFGNYGQTFRVHVLMAKAFLGECPKGEEVRHLDDNSLNNRLENLAYGTFQENVDDRSKNGITRKLMRIFVCPKISYVGLEETFNVLTKDNFSAGGFIIK